MKIKLKLLFVSAAVSLCCSCSDVLDVAPDGKLTYDDIFADHDKVGAYLNTCYNSVQAKGYQYSFWTSWFIGASDEGYDADAEELPTYPVNSMYIGNATSSNHPLEGGAWERNWGAIRKCALFLSRIDNATVKTEADRRRWKAEAYVLRAYYYSELLRYFGGELPIEREPYGLADDFSSLEQKSYKELVDFIIEDCDNALAIEELPWRTTTEAEKFRVTKAIAEAIKSRMILYAASPLNNDGVNLWEEAYTITKNSLAAVEAHGYELYTRSVVPLYTSEEAHLTPENYPAAQAAAAAAIHEYFNELPKYDATATDKETIWQDTRGYNDLHNVQGVGAQSFYKCGICPTQELVDAFETIGGNPVLDTEMPYNDPQHLSPNVNPAAIAEGYDENDPYKCFRDPRFYTTIYFHGTKRYVEWSASFKNPSAESKRRTEVIDLVDGEDPMDNPTGSDLSRSFDKFRTRSRTGYYMRKFLHPTADYGNKISSPGTKHFRLAEMILNFAEAAAEAGHVGEARIALNRIRSRAAMPGVGTEDQAELIRRIRAERRVELAFEEHRFFDTRRWTEPDGDLSSTMRYTTAMKISRNDSDGFTYRRVPNIKGEYKCWENRFLWIPIPVSEASNLESITGRNWQRPGW